MSQMVLPLQLADHAVFGAWLWGTTSTGKTHLLQAVCDRAGDRSIYVPFAMLADAGPTMLEGLESRELICLDDIDRVAGNRQWEVALFNLFNDLHDAGAQLVVSAKATPRECGIELVQPLDEQRRVAALQLRARHRGLELPDETAAYLLKRSRRDMASLYSLLDKLDLEALRAQRRLTIPFVRDVLGKVVD